MKYCCRGVLHHHSGPTCVLRHCQCSVGLPHAEHGVCVAADPLDVGSQEVGLSELQAQLLDHWLHGVQYALLLVTGVQVGYVT